jgi:hypothetical protein
MTADSGVIEGMPVQTATPWPPAEGVVIRSNEAARGGRILAILTAGIRNMNNIRHAHLPADSKRLITLPLNNMDHLFNFKGFNSGYGFSIGSLSQPLDQGRLAFNRTWSLLGV